MVGVGTKKGTISGSECYPKHTLEWTNPNVKETVTFKVTLRELDGILEGGANDIADINPFGAEGTDNTDDPEPGNINTVKYSRSYGSIYHDWKYDPDYQGYDACIGNWKYDENTGETEITANNCALLTFDIVENKVPPRKPSILRAPTITKAGVKEVFEVDDNGDPNYNHVEMKFDWGDGTTTGGIQNAVQKKYNKPGKYTIKVYAVDTTGEISEPVTHEIEVLPKNNDPSDPQVSGLPRVVKNGQSFSFNLMATDPDGDDVYFDISAPEYDELIGPFPSGTEVTHTMAINTYMISGHFEIFTKDAWGGGSYAFRQQVTITRSRERETAIMNSPLLQFFLERGFSELSSIINLLRENRPILNK
jgi:hypothetical protein